LRMVDEPWGIEPRSSGRTLGRLLTFQAGARNTQKLPVLTALAR
jgi:hypothetical protein